MDLNRKTITLWRTKTSSPRAVPLSAAAAGTLAGTPRRLGCAWAFWHEAPAPPGLPKGSVGDRYRNLSSRLREIGQGLKPPIAFRIHDLRHLHAVDWLKGGGSIYDLQKGLGHASIKTTELYLAFLTAEEQRVAMRLGAGG